MELLATAFRVRGAANGSGEFYDKFEEDVLTIVRRIEDWVSYETVFKRVDDCVKDLLVSILLEISMSNFSKINDIVSDKTLDAITKCLMFNLRPGEVKIKIMNQRGIELFTREI